MGPSHPSEPYEVTEVHRVHEPGADCISLTSDWVDRAVNVLVPVMEYLLDR